MKKKQHPSWEGIVPCFESGREYLDWAQHRLGWMENVPPEYKSYFLEVGNAVRHQGYERPIPEKKMIRALERSQRTGEMIDVVLDPEYLPGGAREGQCDGLQYHLELVSKEEYFKRRQREEDERAEYLRRHQSSKQPYIDSDGNEYESYEAYCNSPDLDPYTVMLKLHAGSRTPQNDYERGLLKEMKEIEAKGGTIDFSENIW